MYNTIYRILTNEPIEDQEGNSMNETIKQVTSRNLSSDYTPAEAYGREQAEKVRAYHKSFAAYQPTKLVKLDGLAECLGLGAFYVKDESSRFGLNAFKGLGGSYSIGRYLAEKCGIPEEELSLQKLQSEEIHEQIKDLTFVTATDGNHGRGVAWTCQQLGMKSVVYMPKGSAQERLENIRRLGADASITDLNYDDAVRLAASRQEEYGWILVQDTAWEGYEKIPTWIMQGYTTMALEAAEQLGDDRPTHIFLQAGVGALSGGVTGFFADYYKKDKPKIIIVEPNKADCIFRTAQADDGTIHMVGGDMDTIMAGLACGEPCTLGWEMLRRYADHFVSMPDYVAAKGMRILGNPVSGDEKIVSGESGAAPAGFVAELMMNESLDYMREELEIDENSRVLCFSTEGDTDAANYRKIVWEGSYPSF